MKITALIAAAGRGSRAAHSAGPKQYVNIAGQPLLAHTLERFLEHAAIDDVVVVIHADDEAEYGRAIRELARRSIPTHRLSAPVEGGATRQASVRAGLEALSARSDGPPDAVLIHDAARPFVTASDIDAVVAALSTHTGAIAANPVVDTLKRQRKTDGPAPPTINSTARRDGMWRALTPQAFHFAAIHEAHRRAAASSGTEFTDDASIAEAAGLDVALIETSATNFKITTSADITRASREIASCENAPETTMHYETRTGSGFDVHRLVPGDHVWLCGVHIPHDAALSGHSDADVGMHALTDALYGALGDGDIGHHFPPSDDQWKGAASSIFLTHARDRVIEAGGVIINLDVTIICETPKIGVHRDKMRTRLAGILQLSLPRISVKATTTEKLGFPGRGEGIAAMASATIKVPPTYP